VPRLTKTRVIVVDPTDPDPAALDLGARFLTDSKLVAFATETVYGLGAIATQPVAVGRIFAAKERPAINPLIVHVAGISEARACSKDWPADAQRLAERFWPGPLSLVLLRQASIPDVVTAGRETVALRSPRGAVARGLIERLGQPVAAPSANSSNRISPTRAEHVLADLEGRIDLVIDSGPTTLGLESTVLDLTGEAPRILRPGPISRAELEQVLAGRAVRDADPGERVAIPSSPGQMPVHYAPRTPAYHVSSLQELAGLALPQDLALIVIGEHAGLGNLPASGQFVLESPESASTALYDVLHRCDALASAAIIVILPPDVPQWRAVRDRLMRASRPLAERSN
jgi:L-threonylcarbamoyladenylate synthase